MYLPFLKGGFQMLRLLDDEVRKVRRNDLDGNHERHMMPAIPKSH
jgi:hypothetical protein